MLLTKKFSFDSAHKLLNYNGKCKNLHGHTYFLYVTIKGESDKKTGMVQDFSLIKKIVERKVIDILDHKYINRLIKQPTAENIAIWVWQCLEKDLKLFKIEIWETPDSYVTYYGKND